MTTCADSGSRIVKKLPLRGLPGNAEETGLEPDSIDMLTMASSFHWADFEVATKEFHRVF